METLDLKKVSIVLRCQKKGNLLEVKNYIIEEADKLFCKFGFKSVTMDDIAKHLGMSKKTIYQHFSDKSELVNLLISEKIALQGCAMEDCCIAADNAVHEIFIAIGTIHELLSNMNPKLFYDLQKYHTKAWLMFKEFREQHLATKIAQNLDRGTAEGLFRPGLNKHIITQMRLEQVDIIFNRNENFTANSYSISQVMAEVTEHYLYGICNTKGLELINYYKSQPKKQA